LSSIYWLSLSFHLAFIWFTSLTSIDSLLLWMIRVQQVLGGCEEVGRSGCPRSVGLLGYAVGEPTSMTHIYYTFVHEYIIFIFRRMKHLS
jgi:hypothetical protein